MYIISQNGPSSQGSAGSNCRRVRSSERARERAGERVCVRARGARGRAPACLRCARPCARVRAIACGRHATSGHVVIACGRHVGARPRARGARGRAPACLRCARPCARVRARACASSLVALTERESEGRWHLCLSPSPWPDRGEVPSLTEGSPCLGRSRPSLALSSSHRDTYIERGV